MIVGIDARFYGTENTGLGRYTINALKSIADIDKQTNYVVFVKKKYLKSLKLPGNFRIVACDIPHYSLKEQLILPKLIRENKIDIFYTFHLNAPIFSRTKLVVTIHDLIKSHFTTSDTTTRSTPIFWLKKIGYNLVLKRTLRKAAKIIVPSEFVKNDVMDNFPGLPVDKIIPIHEAPAPIFTKKNNSKSIRPDAKLAKKSFILFVGNAYPHKNLRTLLQAFSILQSKGYRHKLAIVSSPTHFLTKLMNNTTSAIRSKIVRMSNISDSNLLWLYQNSLCTVTPSLMEGFGLVGLESLAVGTPVIASDIPVYREIYKNHVTYLNPLDPQALASALTNIQDVPSNYNYSRTWDTLAREVLGVINEVSISI